MKSFTKDYRVRILCEDISHYYFISGFLECFGINKRKISLAADLPDGKGSGEQFVREQFPVALRELHRHREENVFLVSIMDTDKKDRDYSIVFDILNKAAGSSENYGIKDTDKLLLVFPKRNIETWFEWLDVPAHEKGNINETIDYKPKHKETKPGKKGKEAAELYKKCQNINECNMLSSMRFAHENFQRLFILLEED